MKNYIISNHVWSLIPARSRSKQMKEKNLQKILNCSLVGHAINASKSSKLISRTFVSTDSIKIKQEALKFGAEVPFLRSKKNSGNFSTDYDVVLEFVKKIQQIQNILPKYIIYLRPTTPMRESKILDKAIIKFKKLKNYESLVAVDKMNEPVHKKFFIGNNKLKPIFSNMSIDDGNKPRQLFPASYTLNGYLDIIRTKNIFKKKYLGTKCFPFITPKSIDIDDQFDLSYARHVAKHFYKYNKKSKRKNLILYGK